MSNAERVGRKPLEIRYLNREGWLEAHFRDFVGQMKARHEKEHPKQDCGCGVCDDISMAEFALTAPKAEAR